MSINKCRESLLNMLNLGWTVYFNSFWKELKLFKLFLFVHRILINNLFHYKTMIMKSLNEVNQAIFARSLLTLNCVSLFILFLLNSLNWPCPSQNTLFNIVECCLALKLTVCQRNFFLYIEAPNLMWNHRIKIHKHSWTL